VRSRPWRSNCQSGAPGNADLPRRQPSRTRRAWMALIGQRSMRVPISRRVAVHPGDALRAPCGGFGRGALLSFPGLGG
jgi:hypothetical protein